MGCSGLAGTSLRLINQALKKNQTTSNNLQSLTLHSIHYKDNVYYKTTPNNNNAMLNTNDEEYVEFLHILQQRDTLQVFTLEDVEDTFDLDALVNTLMSGLPNLRELTIKSYSQNTRRLTRESVTKLFQSPTLTSLALRRLCLGDDILPEILVSELDDDENNKVLKKLSLEQNGMGYDCGMALAYVLATNNTLEELYLGYNFIPDTCGSAIAGALSNNKCLKTLDLTSNGFEQATCRRFAHLLLGDDNNNDNNKNHRSCCSGGGGLESLNLSQNSLKDVGVVTIASALETNRTLKSLCLAETQMTGLSCCILSASLQHPNNSTLERLDIANNKVGDDGCISLAQALTTNTTLKSLNLRRNQIGNIGIIRLAQTLVNNQASSGLEKLNLANNNNPRSRTTKAYDALEKLAMNNYNLKHLWLPTAGGGGGGVNVPNSTTSIIQSYIRLNRMGRKQLMQEMDNAQLWVNAIKASGDDINCLYFFVILNPTLVLWLP